MPSLNIYPDFLDRTDPAFIFSFFFYSIYFLNLLPPCHFWHFFQPTSRCEVSQFASRPTVLPAARFLESLFGPLSPVARRLNRRRHLGPTTLSTQPVKYHRAARHFLTLWNITAATTTTVLPNAPAERRYCTAFVQLPRTRLND